MTEIEVPSDAPSGVLSDVPSDEDARARADGQIALRKFLLEMHAKLVKYVFLSVFGICLCLCVFVSL